MRLLKVKIKNFRCFGDEKIIFFDELTTFIGNNSAGKTALIHGLLKLFGEQKKSIVRSDFHLPSNINPEDVESNELYIEAVFDFPELENEESSSASIPIFFKHLVVENTGGQPLLRIRLESIWNKGNTIEGSVDTEVYFITVPEGETIEDKHKKRASNMNLSKIQCLYVPATRNPNTQLKLSTGSIMYRVLNGVNWKEETSNNLKEKINDINTILFEEEGIESLKNTIQSNWKSYHSDNRYDKATLTYNSAEDMNSFWKNIGVKFSPTETERDYDVSELGDGLRSLFYFSLVNSLLEIESEVLSQSQNDQSAFNLEPPVLTILAVEEPENHIAPHLLGKVVKNLIEISDKGNAQTILTSHSPAIIKRVDSKTIRYFRMSEGISTTVTKIPLPDEKNESYKFIKEAVEAYPELYFARLVVLGEGDSEEYVLKRIIENSNFHVDTEGISIVPLGGRHVNHFWKLLNGLNIPHITLLDLDIERHGGGHGRIKYAIEQLILNGVPRKEILALKNGEVLSEERFSNLHKVRPHPKEASKIIRRLEKYNVFFSYPLDLDFMMLESFEDEYKKSLTGNEGPRLKIGGETKKIIELNKVERLSDEYQERIRTNLRSAIKNDEEKIEFYNDKQQELMIWYNYFFLSKSKPITHMRAFEHIAPEKELPGPLERLMEKIQQLITGR